MSGVSLGSHSLSGVSWFIHMPSSLEHPCKTHAGKPPGADCWSSGRGPGPGPHHLPFALLSNANVASVCRQTIQATESVGCWWQQCRGAHRSHLHVSSFLQPGAVGWGLLFPRLPPLRTCSVEKPGAGLTQRPSLPRRLAQRDHPVPQSFRSPQ